MRSPESRPPSRWREALSVYVPARVSTVADRVIARFEIDTRALAAVRISLGLIILIDLLHRAQYLEMFYTDAGVYPVSAYEITYPQFTGLSLHALSGELWAQQLLFVVAGLFAVALIAGYRTRLVGFVSFLLLFSLHARNPAVLNGGDRLFRILLLIALVTPLGERWSIDAVRRGTARPSVASVGTAALLIQPVAVFTGSAIEKYAGELWYTGWAVEVAMANDVMTILLGNVLVEYPMVMRALNYGWLGLLAGAIPFLLLPVGRIRALAALGYLAAFLGMLTTMTVGLFPLVLTTAVLPFLTTPFWDLLVGRIPDKWRAWIPARESLGPVGRPPIERRLLDALRARDHDLVASAILGAARAVVVLAAIAIVVWIVLFTAIDLTNADPPDPVDIDHLEQQRWGLYAPDPSTSYSWYVVEAELGNGSTIEAIDGGPVSFDRPPDAATTYPTFRHRKYMETVRHSGQGYDGTIAIEYVAWACRQPEQEVDLVTLYQMQQSSPIRSEYEEPERIELVRYEC